MAVVPYKFLAGAGRGAERVWIGLIIFAVYIKGRG